MLRLLHIDNKKQYLELLNTFRPVNIHMSDAEFETFYIKVFRTNEIYVWEVDGLIIGTLSLIIEQKFINNCSIYAHIEDVVIKPEYRNNGIGYNMIKAIVTHCEKIGVNKIILNCSEDCKKFYSKNNFTVDGIQMTLKM